MTKTVSEAVIKRLPRYYRYLKDLEAKGEVKVSSVDLASRMGLTASQVRQDFCNFGEFGQQGYGYDVKKLKTEISRILGLSKNYSVIIFGGGNIGSALAGYKGFSNEGFIVKAVFDKFPSKCKIDTVPVYNTDELGKFLENEKVDIAVIATQTKDAPEVAELIISSGIKNIWNFAPIDLNLKKGVIVENMFMSDSLFVLSYKMSHKNTGGQNGRKQ